MENIKNKKNIKTEPYQCKGVDNFAELRGAWEETDTPRDSEKKYLYTEDID